MKITKKTNLNELVMKKPELAGILLNAGMGCVGCPMAGGETIEQGCRMHGMTDKEIDKLVKQLNKAEKYKKRKKK